MAKHSSLTRKRSSAANSHGRSRVERLEDRILLAADTLLEHSWHNLSDFTVTDTITVDALSQGARLATGVSGSDNRLFAGVNQAADLLLHVPANAAANGSSPPNLTASPSALSWLVEGKKALIGSGALPLDVTNQGIISPGDSTGAGVLTLNNFTQTQEGTLHLEIGGLNPGANYDQLQVKGQANLSGAITVSLQDGFTPKAGDTFDIMTFGSMSGGFTLGSGLFGFGDGHLWFKVLYLSDRVQLVTEQMPNSMLLNCENDGSGQGAVNLIPMGTQQTLLGSGLNLGTLDFSGFAGNLDVTVNAAGTVRVQGTSPLGDFLLTADHISSIVGGQGDNTYTFDQASGLNFRIDGSAGQDDLVVLHGDTTWTVDGAGSGHAGQIAFAGLENLTGGANNRDTFVFTPTGSMAGRIDGGVGGFDTLVLDGGAFDTVAYAATGPNSGTVQRDADIITYVGLEPIVDTTQTTQRVLGMSNGDDLDAHLASTSDGRLLLSGSTFESILFNTPSTSLTVQGGTGDDILTLGGATVSSTQTQWLTGLGISALNSLTLGNTQLTVAAEQILLPAGSSVLSNANITLTAASVWSDTGHTAATFGGTAGTAQVLVDGSLITTGDLALTASVSADASVHRTSSGALSLNATTVAQALIDGTAHVEAAALSMQATSDIALTATTTSIATGSATITASQLTVAGVKGNATLIIGSNKVGSVAVDAVNTTTIASTLASDDSSLSSLTGFDLLTGGITLSRTTQAFIGDGTDVVTLAGKGGSNTGAVEVSATNQDASAGGVTGTVNSHLIGVQSINLLQDQVLVSVAGANLKTDGLTLAALNSATYASVAKVATNSAVGSTSALISQATIDAADGNIAATALDNATFTATSSNFQANLGSLSSISVGMAVTSNAIDEDVVAQVTHSTLTAAAVTVSATNGMQIASATQGMSVADQGVNLSGYSLSMGGTYAWNDVTGVVTAAVDHSTLTTASGDVAVSASNGESVDATVDAGFKTTGGSGSAVGVSVAFNAIGWQMGNVVTAGLDALLGTSTGTLDAADTTASITLSKVHAAGNIAVTAESVPVLNATVSNAAESTASSLFGASSMGVAALLVSNRVRSTARAYIEEDETVDILAGGDLVVTATDQAGVYANAKVVSSAMTTSDGGFGAAAATLATYQSSGGTKALQFGNTVALANNYTAGGHAGGIYRYMGTGNSIDLGSTDYSNGDLWQEVKATALFPDGLQVGGGDSLAVGGLVVRNDVRDDTTAFIDQAVVQANTVTVAANQQATITATADSSSVTSKGSAFSSGSSLAVNGVIATNLVLGNTVATITDSSITTASFQAAWAAAKYQSANGSKTLQTGDTVALAADYTGSGTAGGLYGYVGTEKTVNLGTTDYSDTTLWQPITTGNVTVAASNAATITATNTSVLSTGNGAVGVMLAFNTIGWQADNILSQGIDALIGTNIGTAAPAMVSATIVGTGLAVGGDLSVTADNTAEIDATLSNSATAATKSLLNSNSMAASAVLASNMVQAQAEAYIHPTGTTRGTATVSGNLTVAASNAATINSSSSMEAIACASSDPQASILGALTTALQESYQFTTLSGSQLIHQGDLVRVDQNYAVAGLSSTLAGLPGGLYRYLGSDTTLNLGTAIYGDPSKWVQVTQQSLDSMVPSLGNLAASSSMGVGGIVVRNDVRGDVTSYIDNTTVTAGGDVTISATQAAQIEADLEGTATAGEGSAFGTGGSLAVNGQIATNLVLGSASATLTHSAVTAGGSLTVGANNNAAIDASLDAATSASDAAVGVTLAFNTIGWQAQNILFAAIDALVGTDIGAAQTAAVLASATDNTLTIGGGLTVNATSGAEINATVSNVATSEASALFGAESKAASAVLSSNMVNSSATAQLNRDSVTDDGDLSVVAQDTAGVYANTKLEASSITNNTGGVNVLKGMLNNLGGADYLSNAGEKDLKFGDLVRLTQDYAGGGDAGGLYRYLGTAQTVDLTSQDYSDVGYWADVSPAKIIPDINFSPSDSMAIGGLVVRNDVRSAVLATIDTATVTAGSIAVDAYEDATIRATADSTVEASSGEGAFGGSSSLAVNATIATNLVLSGADAHINASTVTTTAGDVALDASNTSYINAKTLNSTTSSGNGVTATLAFNTIGWKAQNILFNAIDALLGDSVLGDAQTAKVTAYLQDTTVNAAGAVTLSAASDATVRANLKNSTDSEAQAISGDASALAVGAVLATNMVNSSATAYITTSTGVVPPGTVNAGGGVTIHSVDSANIVANTKLEVTAAATSDGGVSLAQDAVATAEGIDYSDRSGTQTVKFGDLVILDDADYVTSDEPDTVENGQRVTLDFDMGGGSEGDTYEYVGKDPLDKPSLDEQDFTDTSLWSLVTGTAGSIYRYIGTTPQTVDLGATDYSDKTKWRGLDDEDFLSMLRDQALAQIPPLGDVGSKAGGGLAVRNDVRSDVRSFINNQTVTAVGDVILTADETATILAHNDASVTADDLGIGVVIATNNVLSGANAYLLNSAVTTTALTQGTTTVQQGDVLVDASNTSTIEATVDSAIEASTSVGVVLAFNSIGWESQNFLFNTADALFGTSLGHEKSAETQAWTQNTTIDASGSLQADAQWDGEIKADIVNSAKVINPALTSSDDSSAITVAPVVAMNKISDRVQAFVDAAPKVQVKGDLTITAESGTFIDAEVSASAMSITASGGGKATSVAVSLSAARNEIHNDVSATLQGLSGTPTQVNVGGLLTVSATKDSAINAHGTATAVAVAAGTGNSMAVSGGGTLSFNAIRGSDEALIAYANVVAAGDVSITATDTSAIDAYLHAVALSGVFGTGSVPAVAIGLSVARNFIGGERVSVNSDYTTHDTVLELDAGKKVQVVGGPLDGDVYEYLGETAKDKDGIDLATQNYADSSVWKLLSFSTTPATIHASLENSQVAAVGVLTITAQSTATIDATVLAGAAAVAGSSQNATTVSAAGVYSENRIGSSVEALIDGGGSTTNRIQADSVLVHADNAASINAIAGAASLAASLSGQTGVAISIGLSLAFNSIDADVLASIRGVNAGLVTTQGNVDVSSSATGARLFDVNWGDLTFSAANLDDATVRTPDDSDTQNIDESVVDATNDALTLARLAAALQSRGVALAAADTVHCDWLYTSADAATNLKTDDTVKLTDSYKNGGQAGRVYRYLGSATSVPVNLSTANYADSSRWALVKPQITLSQLDAGKGWLLVDANGTSYTLLDTGGKLSVSRTNINALSAAASVGIGVGGTTGVAVSGAGAVAINAIQGFTDAFIRDSQVTSAGDVTLEAARTSTIAATVAAMSLAAGVGGTTGVGASIGVAVARNFIGYDGNGNDSETTVRAYLIDTSLDVKGNLTLNALSQQSISALVVAGSVAIGGGGTTGVGVSGAGVWAENRISVDVAATITNNGESVQAGTITLDALDDSQICSFGGAASIAAALGGTAGVAVSIGVSLARNTIDNTVTACISGVGQGVSLGDLVVRAWEESAINATTAAASLAAGIGGTAGIAVSGAGAEAKNIILTDVNASIENSTQMAALDVILDARNAAEINALVAAVSLAAGVGGTAGVGASIGVAIARNYIGWNPNAPVDHNLTLDDDPATVQTGDRVLINRGARAGDVYQYIGTTTLKQKGQDKLLLTQDYGDDTLWKQVNISAADAQVRAFILNSSIMASGALTQTALSTQPIQAQVLSGSVALSGGGTAGVALSGAGVSTDNRIGVAGQA
ncbi:MAG: hypothetical protein HQL87_11155, partial [Magnetococcales bacterium]|nr:hypothetical protein [Magnetococcales bacterium]